MLLPLLLQEHFKKEREKETFTRGNYKLLSNVLLGSTEASVDARKTGSCVFYVGAFGGKRNDMLLRLIELQGEMFFNRPLKELKKPHISVLLSGWMFQRLNLIFVFLLFRCPCTAYNINADLMHTIVRLQLFYICSPPYAVYLCKAEAIGHQN